MHFFFRAYSIYYKSNIYFYNKIHLLFLNFFINNENMLFFKEKNDVRKGYLIKRVIQNPSLEI